MPHTVALHSVFSRLKLELAGHETVFDMRLNRSSEKTWNYALHPTGSKPAEMVRVPGDEHDLFLPGIDHLDTEPTRDFLMDRHEVTNRQFKEFVDAGGYENPEYWPSSMVEDGREVGWAEAMTRFHD